MHPSIMHIQQKFRATASSNAMRWHALRSFVWTVVVPLGVIMVACLVAVNDAPASFVLQFLMMWIVGVIGYICSVLYKRGFTRRSFQLVKRHVPAVEAEALHVQYLVNEWPALAHPTVAQQVLQSLRHDRDLHASRRTGRWDIAGGNGLAVLLAPALSLAVNFTAVSMPLNTPRTMQLLCMAVILAAIIWFQIAFIVSSIRDIRELPDIEFMQAIESIAADGVLKSFGPLPRPLVVMPPSPAATATATAAGADVAPSLLNAGRAMLRPT